MFSPWTNPRVQTWSGEVLPFAMEVTGEFNGIVEATFYVENPEDAVPAIPSQFAADTTTGHPDFSWKENTEPDLYGYIIERSLEEGVWAEITGAAVELTEYTDESLVIETDDNSNLARYRVRAIDTQGKYSNYSKIISVEYSHLTGEIDDLVVRHEQPTPTKTYEIGSRNFPNPFNSYTTIEIKLDVTQHIELRIFDVTGRRIRTLHSGALTGGIHHLSWNGKNQYNKELASGVYFYQIKAERFVINKKMYMVK